MTGHQAPPDIEAALVTHLRQLGENAATHVNAPRGAGMIRISRTGGHIPNTGQDAPVITVEVWDRDDDAVWARARDLWVLLTSLEKAGDVWIQDTDLDPPVIYPDPQSPGLSRAQFTGSMRTRMEPVPF